MLFFKKSHQRMSGRQFIVYVVILFVVSVKSNSNATDRSNGSRNCDSGEIPTITHKEGTQAFITEINNYKQSGVCISAESVCGNGGSITDGLAAATSEERKNGGGEGKEDGGNPLLSAAPVFSLANAPAVSAACRRHSRLFLSELRQHQLWALQMWDAGAKLPSGVLRGNANQLGDFDECVAVDSGPLPARGGQSVRGRYCLAEVDVRLAPNDADALDADAPDAPRRDARNLSDATQTLPQALDMALVFRPLRSELSDPGHILPKFSSINWAVCVPATCSEEDVQAGAADMLRRFGQGLGLQLTAAVEPGLCYDASSTPRPLHPATVAVLSVFGLFVLVTLIATFRDKCGKTQPPQTGKLERAVMAFSLRRNWSSLVADLPAEGDIHCIHGIRAILALMIFIVHSALARAFDPYVNRIAVTEVLTNPLSSLIRIGIIYTDGFLLLSGILAAYNLSKEMQRNGSINWIQRYISRYWRLTPPLAAVALFYAHVFEHVGQGPQWGRVVQQNADICKRNLWRNMFYIQNYFEFPEMCLPHSHTLSTEMQLSLLAPPAVALLFKAPLAGAIFLLALNVLSAALRYTAVLDNKVSLVIFYGETLADGWKAGDVTYKIALHRANAYVIGISLGYIIYKTGKKVFIPKALRVCGWVSAAALAHYALLSRSAEARPDFQYDAADAALFACLSTLALALALAWVVFACFTGYGGYLSTFLRAKPLVVFSRISYAFYLSQFIVLFYGVGVNRISQQSSPLNLVIPAELFAVIIISVFITLIFDLPMQTIRTILLKRDLNERKS